MGAATTPLRQPGVARPPRPTSGGKGHPGGRPNSAGRSTNPHSAIAAVGRVSPLSKPATSLRPSLSSKRGSMLTDTDRPHSPSSTPESHSQPQEQNLTQAQTQTPTDMEDLPHAEADDSAPDLAPIDESHQPSAEAMTAVEPEAVAAAVVTRSHSPRLMSVVEHSMLRGKSSAHGATLSTPRLNVGQGFAKWMSRAVGTTALKEKTEIEDLPAYRLRVSSFPPPLFPFFLPSSTFAPPPTPPPPPPPFSPPPPPPPNCPLAPFLKSPCSSPFPLQLLCLTLASLTSSLP